MENITRKNYAPKLIWIILLITAVKIGILYINKTPLWVDEAQYWFWSKFLDTGYYSKPPMIAWIINLFTRFTGDSVFWIRLAAPIIHMITAFYIYLIANKLYDEKVGFLSAISYLTLPAVTFSSFFISSDAPLMLCWAGALYHFITAIELKDDNRFFSWVMFAIWLGLGLLSKYTIVILGFSIGMFVLNRRFSVLFTINFWFSFLLAGLIFLPNILWNLKNGLASFHHTEENLLNKETTADLSITLSTLNFSGLAEFIGGQILVLGPILFIFLFSAIFRKIKSEALLLIDEREAKSFLLYTSIPLVLAGAVIAIISAAQAHWIAPAYISLVILVNWYLLKRDGEFWIKLSIYLGIIISLILSLGILTSDKNFITKISNRNPFERVYEWHSLAAPIRKQTSIYNDAIIASDERKIIAPLTYALRNGNSPKTIYKWTGDDKISDHFDLKFKLPKDQIGNIIFITRSIKESFIRKNFEKVRLLDTANERFNIYLLSGQK